MAGGANRVPTSAAGGWSSKTPTPRAGWAVVGDCGSIIGAQRILYARNVGGLNNLVLAQEEQQDEIAIIELQYLTTL